jgi:hypothetical protein
MSVISKEATEAVVTAIKAKFEQSSTVRLKDIRQSDPAFENPTLVRRGFNQLREAGFCRLVGSKRGSAYEKV